MRILLCAPQDQTVLGIIAGYCLKNLQALGHEVVVFDFRIRPYSASGFVKGIKRVVRAIFPGGPSPYDIGAIKLKTDQTINRALEKLAGSFNPDLVLVLCGENIRPQTIEFLRNTCHAVTVNWLYDTLLLPYRQEVMKTVGRIYDHVFLIDAPEILQRINIPFRHVSTLPVGCEPSVHRKIALSSEEREFYGSDVAFVGTVTPERQHWLEELVDFDLKIWGRWQKESPVLKHCYRQKDVNAQEAVKIYNASKIVLDIHQLSFQQQEIFNVSPRVFEVPASGGFLLTNRCLQIGDLYRLGEEMVVYKDMEEHKKLLRYFLEHEQQRLAIAQRGCEKARTEHTYAKRLKELLKAAGKAG
jgi:spore maturation protein CgeB